MNILAVGRLFVLVDRGTEHLSLPHVACGGIELVDHADYVLDKHLSGLLASELGTLLGEEGLEGPREVLEVHRPICRPAAGKVPVHGRLDAFLVFPPCECLIFFSSSAS